MINCGTLSDSFSSIARQFALAHGFKETNTLSPAQKIKWEAEMLKRKEDRPWQQIKYTVPSAADASKAAATGEAGKPPRRLEGHDTVGLLVLQRDRGLYGGCSSSGIGYKDPGRVGDSPIIGSGLFIDNEV